MEEADSRDRLYRCRICVNCGESQDEGTLSIIYYSEASVSLAKCKYCNLRLDPYVEYEFLLVVFDLMLHRLPAFRHVICNMPLNVLKWLRFTIVINLIEVLSQLWLSNIDPGHEHLPQYLLKSFLTFLASFILFIGSITLYLRKFDTEIIEYSLRSFILSRFPSVLLVIGICWSYSSDFYFVIMVYSFTISMAAAIVIPGIGKSWIAALIAFNGVLPVLFKLLARN